MLSSGGHPLLKSPSETFSSWDGDCQELEHPSMIPASQSHKLDEVGRDLWVSNPPLLKQGHIEEVAQDRVQCPLAVSSCFCHPLTTPCLLSSPGSLVHGSSRPALCSPCPTHPREEQPMARGDVGWSSSPQPFFHHKLILGKVSMGWG